MKKIHLTAQQHAFFTERGYIAFENLPLDFTALQRAIAQPKETRDLWRKSPELLTLATRKIGPLVKELVDSQPLFLACDEWLPSSEPWDQSKAIQERLSFQHLSCIVCLLFDGKSPIFFLHPSCWPGIIPLWPKESADCYLIAYGTKETIYRPSPKDPHASWLKKFGFAIGDNLRQNPMIY